MELAVLSLKLSCVCSGRGMKNGDNFKLLYDLADKFGAAGTVSSKSKALFLLSV